jgi:hypothetical protein
MKKKMGGGGPKQLKGVTIVGKRTAKPTPKNDKSVVQGMGEVPKSRVDSARRANPALNRALGKAGKGSGGMDEYREGKADLVKSALSRPKKK